MLSNKTFRPLVLVAAVAFMLMAVTSVEAAPKVPDALACVPNCNIVDCTPPCRRGTWCDFDFCNCKTRCRSGIPP
ncbi:hypothetical protein BGX29_002808 [Mortierella sp. GBA35]|nr:hypothetical protein BGX23_003130 [Mortierella sp. AD031]KAF9083969.1 hypothetical protein BGX29_002808 [Mortierella sp. GBA35]KAG0196381.1 hypothetical protein BGX33_001706 [Mortierella sp. NVP41]